jgi:hypothetical protein
MTTQAATSLRGWSGEQWSAAHAALAGRGLMAGDALTDAGVALRERVEADTDRMAAAPWRHLGEQRTLRMIELGKSLTSVAVAAGAFPPGIFAAPR